MTEVDLHAAYLLADLSDMKMASVNKGLLPYLAYLNPKFRAVKGQISVLCTQKLLPKRTVKAQTM